jgi:non-ribosomal peptide synthetase component F
VSATVCEVDSQTAKYDLLLNLTDSEIGLTGWMEYSTDLFATASIARMLSLFETLLNAIAVQSEVKLSVLKEMLNTADQQWQIAKEQELKEARLLKFKNVKRKAIEQLV